MRVPNAGAYTQRATGRNQLLRVTFLAHVLLRGVWVSQELLQSFVIPTHLLEGAEIETGSESVVVPVVCIRQIYHP